MLINNYYDTLKQDDDVLLFLEEEQMQSNDFLQNNLSDRMVYFSQYVRRLHDGEYTYLEAIVEFCQSHDISYEDAIKLLSPDLKSQLEIECIKNKMIKQDDNELGSFTL
jgi:hypothetical protein